MASLPPCRQRARCSDALVTPDGPLCNVLALKMNDGLAHLVLVLMKQRTH